MKISMPEQVKKIINTIEAAGFEAYAVGGCVRDSVLGREPEDWDITTSAYPEHIKELFPRTIDTGIKHGTVTVMVGKEGFEITTYRIDGEYENNRHPKEVMFTASLTEDLKRRDFTINAMAYNGERGLIDLFDGTGDIRRRMIRCVGDPMERFGEDALRMMRAIRFSAQLGYDIELKTKEAICRLASSLKQISAERIQMELMKLLLSPHPEYLKIAYETGITGQVLPEFDRCMETKQHNPHHIYSVGEHTLHTLCAVRADRILRLTMLIHDFGKPETQTEDEHHIHHFYGHQEKSCQMAEAILKRLRFDHDTLTKVIKLVRYHDVKIIPEPAKVRRAVNKIGEDIFPLLLEVKYADMQSQSDYHKAEKEENLRQIRLIYDNILEEKDCVSLKTLAVSGKDLIEVGMKPGAEFGIILNQLLDLVMENPQYNTREYLLQKISVDIKK